MTRLGNEAIVYDVKAGETVFASLRPFIARFKEIFDGGASFSAALTYEGLDLLIPATGANGTVEFPMDFSTAGTLLDAAVAYKMTHGSPTDLTISLVAPSGVAVTLRNAQATLLNEIVSTDGRQAEGFTVRTVSLQSLNNTQTKGVWKLRIVGNSAFSPNGVGKLQLVKLMLKLKSN